MKSILINTCAIFFVSISVFAQNKDDIRNLDDHVAIEGYDPVAYFIENKAVEGKKQFAANIDGAIYYTSSEKNKEMLEKNPEKYQPQFGGWCAYAMGDDGSYLTINPKAYKIVDGKLYLFYKNIFSNTLKKWNKKETELMKDAKKNWKEKMKMKKQ